MAKKAKYKDEPRYPLIREYEKEMKSSYRKTSKDVAVGLIDKMAGMFRTNGFLK